MNDSTFDSRFSSSHLLAFLGLTSSGLGFVYLQARHVLDTMEDTGCGSCNCSVARRQCGAGYTIGFDRQQYVSPIATAGHICAFKCLTSHHADSIKAAARTLADSVMSYYTGNKSGQIIGLLPDPYYWWEAGAMFGEMVEYWFYTGDTTYNDVTTQALLFQAAPTKDYMPNNQTKTEVRILSSRHEASALRKGVDAGSGADV